MLDPVEISFRRFFFSRAIEAAELGAAIKEVLGWPAVRAFVFTDVEELLKRPHADFGLQLFRHTHGQFPISLEIYPPEGAGPLRGCGSVVEATCKLARISGANVLIGDDTTLAPNAFLLCAAEGGVLTCAAAETLDGGLVLRGGARKLSAPSGD